MLTARGDCHAKDGLLVIGNAIDRERNRHLIPEQKPLYCTVDDGIAEARSNSVL